MLRTTERHGTHVSLESRSTSEGTEERRRRTISASSYSLKTSSVERRVPLRIVGSSADAGPEGQRDGCCRGTVGHSRGMMVSLLRRSVSPMLAMSRPSMRMRPSTGSTNRKNESARVLLPDPVRPRTPTFSPGRTSKDRWCSTLGRSGCPIAPVIRQGPRSRRDDGSEMSTNRVSDHQILALNLSARRPGRWRPGFHEFGGLARKL